MHTIFNWIWSDWILIWIITILNYSIIIIYSMDIWWVRAFFIPFKLVCTWIPRLCVQSKHLSSNIVTFTHIHPFHNFSHWNQNVSTWILSSHIVCILFPLFLHNIICYVVGWPDYSNFHFVWHIFVVRISNTWVLGKYV